MIQYCNMSSIYKHSFYQIHLNYVGENDIYWLGQQSHINIVKPLRQLYEDNTHPQSCVYHHKCQ